MIFELEIRRGAHRGFTLLEMLVVIAVIAILAAMVLPALSKAKQSTIRIVCQNNQHQEGLAYTQYALDNKERLPTSTGAYSNELWILDYNEGTILAKYGAPYKVWYDPGLTGYNDSDHQQWWQGTNNPNTGEAIRFVQYSQVNAGGYYAGSQYRWLATNGAVSIIGGWFPMQYSVDGPVINYWQWPVSTPLLACATIAEGCSVASWPGQKLYFKWTAISHSNAPLVPGNLPFSSAHMANARFPAGANVTMLDGHTEWRPFLQMLPRSVDPNFEGGLTWYY